ncbi:MAG: phBC6A51 family helix-turn-helix protein [Patescibacteria group bacterium]|nr:phBC6A51 family helix-turn-helix protein [Patescibacteria group bacterium]
MSNTIEHRQQKQKNQIIEQLKQTPIVEIACKKCEVGRSTYYRWIHEDEEFALSVEVAIEEGAGIVSDLAESQLLAAIQNGNLQAVFYWLNHRNPKFINKLEVSAKSNEPLSLTAEQEDLIKKALELAAPEPVMVPVPDLQEMKDEDKDENAK